MNTNNNEISNNNNTTDNTNEKKKKKWEDDDKKSTSSFTLEYTPRESTNQIGRFINIEYIENPLTIKQQFILSYLHLLPSFIKTLSIKLKDFTVTPTFPQ